MGWKRRCCWGGGGGGDLLCRLTLVLGFLLPACRTRLYTNHWAVRIAGGLPEANRIASKYGYVNIGQIGTLKDYYHFYHSKTIKRSVLSSRGTHSFISMEPKLILQKEGEVFSPHQSTHLLERTEGFLVSPADILLVAGLWQGLMKALYHELRAFFSFMEFPQQNNFGDTAMHETMGAGAKNKGEEDEQNHSIGGRYHEALIQLLSRPSVEIRLLQYFQEWE